RITCWHSSQLDETLQRLFGSAFEHQPTERRGQEVDSDTQEQSRHHLEQERQPSCPVTSNETGAVSDPESKDNPSYNAEFLQNQEPDACSDARGNCCLQERPRQHLDRTPNNCQLRIVGINTEDILGRHGHSKF